MLIVSLIISISLAIVSSYWIDYLYSSPNVPLSFKDSIEQRSRYRKVLFVICMFGFIENLSHESAVLMAYSIVAAFFLLSIMITDFEQYVIFNKMLLPFAIIGLIATFHLDLSVVDHLIAAFLGGMFFLFLAVISNGALGGGDVKLIAAFGLWFGTEDLLQIIIISSILAGISAFVMLITKIKSRQDYFAYGPYFCITAIYFIMS